MANRSIGTNDLALHAIALTPGSEDVVTLPARFSGDPTVLVHPSADGAPVYVATSTAAATVGGAHTRAVWPGNALRLDDATTIRLISATAAVYSIELA
jgi:hypothetical protein